MRLPPSDSENTPGVMRDTSGTRALSCLTRSVWRLAYGVKKNDPRPTTTASASANSSTGRNSCVSPMPQAASTVISLSRYQRLRVSRMPK